MRVLTLLLVCALAALGTTVCLLPNLLTDAHAINVLHALLPFAAYPAFSARDGSGFVWLGRPTRLMRELADAPWPGSWVLPELRQPVKQDRPVRRASEQARLGSPSTAGWGGHGRPTEQAPDSGPACADDDDESPVLLMLHVFSRSTPDAFRRRQLFRAHSPLATIPRAYRHLVEFRFILGRPVDTLPAETIERLNADIDAEAATYGDIVRLEGLRHGDNLNEGRTFAWLDWVTARQREAWWVVKCDDDTLPLLPNLLPYLLEQDAQVPTYFGNPLAHAGDRAYFADGAMYGMSWGVAKTIGAANVSEDDKTRWEGEDYKVGRAMLSLPDAPRGCAHDRSRAAPVPHAFYPPGAAGLPAAVRSLPNARTGLVRLGLAKYIGEFERPWIRGWRDGMAWHHLKDERKWLEAWDYAVDGFASVGRRFEWVPPASMAHLVALDRPSPPKPENATRRAGRVLR